MSAWDSLLAFLSLPQLPKRRIFELDEDLYLSLQELASSERRPARQLANDLLAEALAGRRVARQSLVFWRALSRREQEVAALVCLGYTGPQIAVHLSIAPETVKTHVSNILAKGELHNRQELRNLFTGWDFSRWE